MNKKQREKIEDEFSDIIREKMSDIQFWKWFISWYDIDLACEIAENWDIETKVESLPELRKIIKKK